MHEVFFCFCYSENEITSLFSKYNNFNALYVSVHKKDVLNIYIVFLYFTVLITYILVFNLSFIVCRNMLNISYWKLPAVVYVNSNIKTSRLHT